MPTLQTVNNIELRLIKDNEYTTNETFRYAKVFIGWKLKTPQVSVIVVYQTKQTNEMWLAK